MSAPVESQPFQVACVPVVAKSPPNRCEGSEFRTFSREVTPDHSMSKLTRPFVGGVKWKSPLGIAP